MHRAAVVQAFGLDREPVVDGITGVSDHVTRCEEHLQPQEATNDDDGGGEEDDDEEGEDEDDEEDEDEDEKEDEEEGEDDDNTEEKDRSFVAQPSPTSRSTVTAIKTTSSHPSESSLDRDPGAAPTDPGRAPRVATVAALHGFYNQSAEWEADFISYTAIRSMLQSCLASDEEFAAIQTYYRTIANALSALIQHDSALYSAFQELDDQMDQL